MNFLSHYYAIKEENPYFILGTVMPDMVNDFSKIYNQFIEDKFLPSALSNSYMLRGVENHIKADDIFHKHPLFDEMQSVAKEEMKSIFGDSVRRQFVIAHVLIELMIDQFIITNEQKVLTDFYKKLDEVEILEANKFYEKLNVHENESRFKRNFTKFKELKFLFHLKENEGVIFTLDKVFAPKLQHNFIADQQKWDKTISLINKKIKSAIPTILEDVKTRLYE